MNELATFFLKCELLDIIAFLLILLLLYNSFASKILFKIKTNHYNPGLLEKNVPVATLLHMLHVSQHFSCFATEACSVLSKTYECKSTLNLTNSVNQSKCTI